MSMKAKKIILGILVLAALLCAAVFSCFFAVMVCSADAAVRFAQERCRRAKARMSKKTQAKETPYAEYY